MKTNHVQDRGLMRKHDDPISLKKRNEASRKIWEQEKQQPTIQVPKPSKREEPSTEGNARPAIM